MKSSVRCIVVLAICGLLLNSCIVHNNKFQNEVCIIYLNQKMYESIPNPVSLTNTPSYDSIFISSTGAEIIQPGNKSYFICKPTTLGKIWLHFELFKNNKCFLRDSIRCDVASLPNPVLDLPLINNKLPKIALLQRSKLNCEVINLSVDIPCRVKSFCMTTLTDGHLISACSNDDLFSAEQKLLIENLKEDNYLIIDQIVVEMPNKSFRSIPPIAYRIIE